VRTLLVAIMAVALAVPALASEPVAVAVATPARPELVEGAVVVAGDVVTLSGSSSSTVNGTFLWTQVQGPAVVISHANEMDATVTCAAPGAYGFELTVVDAGGSAADTVLFSVGSPLAAPAAGPYILSNTVTGNGVVKVNGVAIPGGASTTFITEGLNAAYTFFPDSGYQVSTVVVDAVNQSPLPASYTFTAVAANHTMAVTFVLAPPAPSGGGGGGGGGGGCSMVSAGNANALGWALPYGVLLAGWLLVRTKKGR